MKAALCRRIGLSALLLSVAALGSMAQSASATTVLSQNWEAGLGTWTVQTDSGNVAWHVETHPETHAVVPGINPTLVTLPDSGQLPAAFQGMNAAWFGDPVSGTFCGPDWATVPDNATPKNGCTSTTPQAGSLISPTVDLTGATSAIVSFASWFEIESVDADRYDVMTVDYSIDNGVTWITGPKLNPASNPAGAHDQSYSNNGLEQSPSWTPTLVDMSAAVGHSQVKFRFSFDSKDALYQGFRGWLLDSIELRTPFDAPTPAISGVTTCKATLDAPVTEISGQNFILDSVVLVDGAPATANSTTSSTHIEIPALSAGAHTIQVKSPNGALSNVFSASGGSCAPPPPPPPPPAKRPTATQVSCNYLFATALDTCTATVGDAGAPPRPTPTGSVAFASTGGGVFIAGTTCNLTPTPSSPGVASCSVQYLPPAAAGNPGISATYGGDATHNPSSGSTTFLLAGLPPDLISGLSTSPSSFLAAPSGPAFSAAKKTYGTRVSFTLKAPAVVVFTVQKQTTGRRSGNKCVKQRASNRKKKACVRYAALAGSFTMLGQKGANSVLFRGRIGGKKLKPGRYSLTATPSVLGKVGTPISIGIQVKKK
ncbi:MAG: hypothetical protein NVSMB51_03050 [Solirubrobacteraceae bacterium]